MKLRSKIEKQKVNNRKIQRERESRNIVDLKYLFPKNKKQNRIEQNMKLKLTDNCVEPEDGGRSV